MIYNFEFIICEFYMVYVDYNDFMKIIEIFLLGKKQLLYGFIEDFIRYDFYNVYLVVFFCVINDVFGYGFELSIMIKIKEIF